MTGAVVTATLRVGIHSGIDFESDKLGDLSLSIGAGIETVVYADILQFASNITINTGSGCEVEVEESYSFGLGAEAGASIAIANQTWGPNLETATPIYYTTLAKGCVSVTTPSSTSTAAAITPRGLPVRRDNNDLTTTTITKTETFTGIACESSGMINCPVSLQTTTKATSIISLVTSVPSGSTATFPASVQSAVTPIAFGTGERSIASSSGSPVSYTPKATSSGTPGGTISNIGNVFSKGSKAKIIGISVGLGVPILLALVAFLM
jgi:hypothetical protein